MSLTWVDGILWVLGGILAVPSAVFFLECLMSAFARSPRVASDGSNTPRFAILVPAHDEEPVIRETLVELGKQTGSRDRIVVVADNCTDRTAEIAREVGADVVERVDPDSRGMGFALVFGLDYLEADPPDVVVVVDADCRAEEGALARIAREAIRTGGPVQAEYLLTQADDSPRSVISALAFLVRNRVRPRGLAVLGLPGHLTGSGMAFPWRVLRDAPHTESYLVEDLLMGIQLALAGTPPRICPAAQVTSVLPTRGTAALGQRRRWEHGQLETLRRWVPRLVGQGLRRLDPGLIALGLDLAVPPLALLVLLQIAFSGLALLAAWLGASPMVLGIAAANLGLVGLGVLIGRGVHGRASIPLRYLITVPFYVLWKVPLYLSFFARRRQRTWERTERS